MRDPGDSSSTSSGSSPSASAHALCLAVVVLTSTERLVETNGVQLRVIEAGERVRPVVVLAHGFPELAYSWRHQIPALAEAGYHVLAPDQRGYGGSVEARRRRRLRHRRPDRRPRRPARRRRRGAGGVRRPRLRRRGGRGAPALLHPGPVRRRRRAERSAGAAAEGADDASVPARCSATTSSTSCYFQEPGPADAELNRDPATTMRRLMGSLTTTDEAAALRMLQPGPRDSSTAFRSPAAARLDQPGRVRPLRRPSSPAPASPAPLNWYRNFDRNWELTATTPAATIDCAVAVHRRSRRPDAGLHAAPTASARWSPATTAK